MTDCYVYAFTINTIPFYIGSGRRREEYTNPYRREWEHLKEASLPISEQNNPHKCSYLSRAHTFEILFDNLTLEQSREKELELILKHKRICDGGTLTNIVVENLAHNTRRTAVFQFTTEGEFVQQFTSIRQASKETGILPSGIVNCCKGVNATSGGFVWGYTKDFPGYTKPQGVWNKRAVDQYTLEGVFVSSYDSSMEAERQTGINNGDINGCVRGGASCLTAGGFVWVEAGGEFIQPQPKANGRPAKQVQQLNKVTNEVVNTYDSINEAIRQTGFTGIQRCVMGLSKSSGGYNWRLMG